MVEDSEGEGGLLLGDDAPDTPPDLLLEPRVHVVREESIHT